MDRNLGLEAVRVTEAAALAAARFMGRGDIEQIDVEAAKAMRKASQSIAINGQVVIGESAESDASLIRQGDELGSGKGPDVDVAIDPLEGTAICASGGNNALAIVAFAERGGFLKAPGTHMEKMVVGPDGAEAAIDLDRSTEENLTSLAEAKGVYVADLTVAILDRPRNRRWIESVREAGARIRLLADGDVAAGVATGKVGSGIDMLLGIGGSSQGIVTAAAVRCMGGDMQARLRPRDDQEASHLRQVGIEDLSKKFTLQELASGSIMFAATGVTNGELLRGVRFLKGGALSNSIVMRSRSHTSRYIEAVHRFDLKPDYS